ncbi:isoprenylcysteine carboxylmethyltransferase family protein [Methanosarcina sp. Z-7115]|uniref:Isoprenylcysteine carboxylmethyltransferase family protein n=1 Tax=Methanosarcina baikalica TaxID=3073890 RepID=A0ABU2D0P2_9EURY|nr:isoprenylcysteine carboxylmethyltransferase family protein [Methanosarcina sp. Z-7115]MDR7665544.1 isoprenylcysteine carboxylmethyltransferase family protein [Methanosarcina sp. Z-7115]
MEGSCQEGRTGYREPILHDGIVLFSAGRLDLSRAWIFFSLYLVSLFFNMVLFLKLNPEIISACSGMILGEMKWWDKLFETTVRVQKERGRKVVSTGPYSIVRHPGYAGMILFYGCTPFIIVSLYGLIPVLLLAVAFVFRTYFEDRLLYKELSGYKEYAKKVRYRLVPFIW